MKKYLLGFVLLFVMTAAFSQPGKKPAAKKEKQPAQKEKPPTQKELDEMMNEMQQAMDEISPEDKKMMDSMGIKLPDTKSIQKSMSGISDAQLNKAYEEDGRIVPLKDVARINIVLATTLSNAEMSTFITKTHQLVLGKLSAITRSKGAEIVQQVVKLNSSVANTAVGLWMDGKPTLALYLIGEACKNAPDNANNLNNYASFLTMCGAEQMALPILINLNKRYPKNSSLLNNIAQAWLGLGDIPRAENYADSAIRLYPAHPQANMAKCLIEESKGNIPTAIAAAKKGISKAYSTEKENKLNKLGYTLKTEDINWDRPMPQDPMGLEKFSWPEYPMNVENNKLLAVEWDNFKNNCQEKIDELKRKQKSAEEAFLSATEFRHKKLISESQQGHYVQMMPGYAAKAIKKLGPLVNDINGNMSFVFAQELETVIKAVKRVEDYEKLLEEKQRLLDQKYKDKIGEGKQNPLAAICNDENEIRTEFLKNANSGLQSAYRQYFNYVSRRTSDLLYYYQYTQWPEQFELAKVNAQIAWLTQIKDQKVMFKDKSSWCINTPKTKLPGSLQNFDDVACNYVSTMNLGIYKITSSCSNLVGEFDFGGVEINYRDNVETGKYSGTAIVGTSKSIGPMGLEGEATAGGLVEWDNSGITDVGVVAGVAVNSGPVTIASAGAKVTVNSGISKSGKFLGQQ